MNIVLLGAPGSGKGTQAERLQEELGLTHIATGDLFRENLNAETELGVLAAKYMNRGDLVPDEVTVAMLKERIQRPDAEHGVILDGFPRTINQAIALFELLSQLGRNLDGVLYLEVSEEELVTRLSGRMVCRECQATFHESFNPFQKCPHGKCEGEHLYQRDDDKPATVKARLATYREQTSPLIDHYREAGLLVTVPGVGSVDEIQTALLTAARSLER
jgi:adenylate kinase